MTSVERVELALRRVRSRAFRNGEPIDLPILLDLMIEEVRWEAKDEVAEGKRNG